MPILPAVPVPAFQLTPRPFEAVGIDRTAYLPVIEGLCRFLATLQDDRGAIIDPIVKVECQYSTPYFAFGVGVLVGAGHAPELLAGGIRAMDHATCCFAGGSDTIPQRHGEFFLAYLPAALEPYRPLIAAELWETWRERLKLPLDQVIQGPDNNWRTYAMRGEWLRASLGLADPAAATAFVTRGWRDPGNGETAQRDRIVPDLWNLYQDGQTDPQSHAVEAVGRLNLLGLVEAGFDGPDAAEILACAERGTLTSLLLQSPDGQCPPNGRTDDHVFNDVLYQAAFEIMAERALKLGELELAARYRRAALLSFKSLARWRRTDGEWAGSFTVTKNRFPPEERVGYQPASQVTNYNGALVAHLADCYLEQGSEIPELPAPCEVGGYAFATDEKFASAVANAGGMQLFAALRGDTEPKFDHCWTPLGVNRFSRAGWDGRLGPGDGVRDAKTGRGVSFGPTWFEDGHWVRIADVPHRYRGHFSVEFVHPLLVRCAINYRPLDGTGPTFHHGFVVTPDGVLATLTSDFNGEFGVTWPILENDGRDLHVAYGAGFAATGYTVDGDQQCFLAVSGELISREEAAVQGTYGWLRPIRALARGRVNQTFIYPRTQADPTPEAVLRDFWVTEDGFRSPLGRVTGSFYVGRTSAGGTGTELGLTANGSPDLRFSRPCEFVARHSRGRITEVETNLATTAAINGQVWDTGIHRPKLLPPSVLLAG